MLKGEPLSVASAGAASRRSSSVAPLELMRSRAQLAHLQRETAAGEFRAQHPGTR